MKRVVTAIIGFALLFLMSACVSGASSSEGTGEVQLPNPMVEYPSPDFSEVAGFQVLAYPDYTLENVWLIDNRIGQLNFFVDNATQPIFRVAEDTGQDISGDYTVYGEITTENISDIEVTFFRNDTGPARAEWVKDGYAFSLYVENGDGTDFFQLTQSFVTEVEMNPVPAPPVPG